MRNATDNEDYIQIPQTIGGMAGALSNAVPQPLGTAAAGVGTAATRDDHVHAHGDLAGGTLHAAAVSSTSGGVGGSRGFMLPFQGELVAYLATASQALSGAGAASILVRTTRLTTSGVGQVVTLANSPIEGQRKSFVAKSGYNGTNTTVITPATFADGATVTLSTQYDSVELEWQVGGWQIVAKSDGAVVA